MDLAMGRRTVVVVGCLSGLLGKLCRAQEVLEREFLGDMPLTEAARTETTRTKTVWDLWKVELELERTVVWIPSI
jgi:hypothetical protein